MTKLEELIAKLSELFELEKADLDFGIHRIIKSKHKQIRESLETRLPQRVQEELDKLVAEESSSQLESVLAEVTSTFGEDAVNESGEIQDAYASTPLGQKYITVREASAGAEASAKIENEVYSHLLEFFSRYYEDLDFMSLRRRTAGREAYSIPYNGEEVVLHWANKDQYYIKSSEDLKNYAFTAALDPAKDLTSDNLGRVQFKLSKLDTVHDDSKASRIFQLDDDEEITESDNDIVIPFYFAKGAKRTKASQAEWEDSILKALPARWQKRLSSADSTFTGDGERTVLQKHLRNYTRKNTSDYFIHKGLRGFLRRELDFYIKNEVMYLDDVDNRASHYLEGEIRKIKAIRAVARDLVDFIGQFETFQKRLWEKKKFVVEENWCVTIDLVPEELHSEIVSNARQREEWVNLFEIDKIAGDLTLTGYSEPLSVEFLKENGTLPLDTALFGDDFRLRLASSLDFDATSDNLLVHSDSFQALSLLQQPFRQQVKFFYLDPPYNTGSDEFLYKDNYRQSSWLAMMWDRLSLAHKLLSDDGSVAVSIDQHSLGQLRQLLDATFGRENLISTITVKRATVSGPKVVNPGVVNISDYVLLYAKNRAAWVGNPVFSERDRDDRYSSFISNRSDPYTEWSFCTLLEAFAKEVGVDKNDLRSHLGDDYESKLNEFVLANAESVIQPCLVRPSNVSADYRAKLKESSKNPDEVVFFERKGLNDVYLKNSKLLLFYSDKVKKIGDRLATAERASDIWTDVLPNDLHNEGGVDLEKGKKPEALVSRLVALCSEEGDLVGDFFLGSGTTAAVAQKMHRRWFGIEMSDYFESKPVLRMKRVLAGESKGVSDEFEWTGGGAFRRIYLESYEDALNNLAFSSDGNSNALLAEDKKLQDEYLLKYSLDVETRDSLLDCARFSAPFDYTMLVLDRQSGVQQETKLNLPATFNFLLGLTVRMSQMKEGVLIVEGENPASETVLVVWRTIEEMDNEKLDEFITKTLRINTADTEYAAIYINGDTTLNDPHKKIMLTEQVFHDLMFDTEDA